MDGLVVFQHAPDNVQYSTVQYSTVVMPSTNIVVSPPVVFVISPLLFLIVRIRVVSLVLDFCVACLAAANQHVRGSCLFLEVSTPFRWLVHGYLTDVYVFLSVVLSEPQVD